MPRISIIVPVYNVEQYIHRCIDSILIQTFTDFELILVDDGSPDKCGEICDEYAKKDNRIMVIHKENGGPADARNSGLVVAQGNYIGFVDSDDYIDKEMYEKLYNKCKSNNIDVAMCGRVDVYENKSKTTFTLETIEMWSSKDAIRNLLIWNNIDSSPCDKLFNIDLFKNIRFPINKNVEDIYVIYKLIDLANGVVHIGEPLYYYCHRSNSRSVEEFSEKRLDILEVSLEIKKFVSIKFPDLEEEANSFYIKNAMFLYNLLQTKSVRYNNFDSYREVKGHITKNIFKIMSNSYIDNRSKIISILIFLGIYGLFKDLKDRGVN